MNDRRPVIAANWKMHHDHLAAIRYTQQLGYLLDPEDARRLDVVLCPPFPALRSVQTTLEADRIPVLLGAQHVHWEDEGPFTGEVSPLMLAKLGVRYVIVGHSERRQLFGETDETVNRRVRAVVRHGMTPIVCVGETADERDGGRTVERVRAQVTAAFEGVPAAAVAAAVVAYEPVWAIGTGRTPTPDDAQATAEAIRDAVGTFAGGDAHGALRVQYGGSVKVGNIGEFMARPGIDGALVGGASLDPDEFARLLRAGLVR
jgi:triosephosphate isomerase